VRQRAKARPRNKLVGTVSRSWDLAAYRQPPRIRDTGPCGSPGDSLAAAEGPEGTEQ